MNKRNDILRDSNKCSNSTMSITKGENTMNKKHFEAIAEDINKRAMVVYFSQELSRNEKYTALHTLLHMSQDLGSTFSRFNDNFNYQKFIDACDVAGYIAQHVEELVK